MKKTILALLIALTFSISAFAEGITPIMGLIGNTPSVNAKGDTPAMGATGDTPIMGATGNTPITGYGPEGTFIQIISALRHFYF
jgi:hypothetical protein